MKPRLTAKVLRGLSSMATLARAGGCDDFTGNSEDDPESKAVWQEALRACDWIDAMEAYRSRPKTNLQEKG